MNTEITGNEPAMPTTLSVNHGELIEIRTDDIGLTIRQNACIQLELPETGVEWLDKLIAKKQRQSVAAKAMEGLLSNEKYTMSLDFGRKEKGIDPLKEIATSSIDISDTLLSELNKTVEP